MLRALVRRREQDRLLCARRYPPTLLVVNRASGTLLTLDPDLLSTITARLDDRSGGATAHHVYRGTMDGHVDKAAHDRPGGGREDSRRRRLRRWARGRGRPWRSPARASKWSRRRSP